MAITLLAETQYHKLEGHSSTVRGIQRKTFGFPDLWLAILLEFIILSLETVRMIIAMLVIIATIPPVVIAMD